MSLCLHSFFLLTLFAVHIMSSKATHKKALRNEHIRRCKEIGKSLLDFICDKNRYFNQSIAATISLDKFKDEFTSKLKDIDGLEHLSADDFPSLRTAAESVWRNEGNPLIRQRLLGKLFREVITALYPSSINIDGKDLDLGRRVGDCTGATCRRNFFSMDGSSFHGAHVDDTAKTLDPCEIALIGVEAYFKEMEDAGIVPTCAMCHDGAKERITSFVLDDIKHHLLSPPKHPIRRDQGRNLLQILRDDRVCRLQYLLFFMDAYCRGMMKDRTTDAHYGDYNTLRVMFLAYFDSVADDFVKPTARQWNSCDIRVDTKYYITKGLKYVVQKDCGVCPGANEAGTTEALAIPRGSREARHYACCEENFDFRKYNSVERQRIEGDHTIPQCTTDDSKNVGDCWYIFELLDEICHAPFHCYFCHKRLTANQYKKKSWHRHVRDYIIEY